MSCDESCVSCNQANRARFIFNFIFLVVQSKKNGGCLLN